MIEKVNPKHPDKVAGSAGEIIIFLTLSNIGLKHTSLDSSP